MKTFKRYLSEKYSFIPKNPDVIAKQGLPTGLELTKLFYEISKETDIEDPLAIDLDNPKSVKIHRDLQGMFDLKDLKSRYNLNIDYGNGSRGNRGANNRGNFFETVLAGDIELYIESRDENAEYVYKDFMREFIRNYLSKHKTIEVKVEGGLNKPRPLVFSGSKIAIQNTSITDIGATVTDVTVYGDGKPYYLSLKLGSTITLFNAGVRKYLTSKDLEDGQIRSKQGQALLDLFGIDHDRYIETFAKYDTSGVIKNEPDIVNVLNRVNRVELENFLATGLGFGYFFVHAKNAKPGAPIHYLFMDKSKALQSVKVQTVMVKYPKPGSAKRIDVLIETPHFEFKVNIRNKQGGIAPSHVMCDYKFK